MILDCYKVLYLQKKLFSLKTKLKTIYFVEQLKVSSETIFNKIHKVLILSAFSKTVITSNTGGKMEIGKR